MRKSILACTVSFLMSPMASWALGLGDVQVNSALNQPLNAEIELHSVTKKDLDTLRVGLASRSVYSRTKVERHDYLSRFRFKLIKRNGKNYISITTRKAFREPFASFLMEANWRSGRLLREYTILLDPPEFIKKQTQAVTIGSATSSTSNQVKRLYVPSESASKSNSSTVYSNYTSGYEGSNSNSSELSYGPTVKHDTLWSIAKAMAPPNVSINQMMLALLRDNPEAFDGNNINTLKQGYVLRIKNRTQLNQISKVEATRQAMKQHQSWQNIRQQEKNANVVERDVQPDKVDLPDAELKLVTAGVSEQASDSSGSADTQKIREKLALAEESIESRKLENQELRERIQELEDLVAANASLLELKDQSLSLLQEQVQETLEEEEEEEEVEEEISSTIENADTDKEADSTVSAQSEAAEQEIAKAEMAKAEAEGKSEEQEKSKAEATNKSEKQEKSKAEVTSKSEPTPKKQEKSKTEVTSKDEEKAKPTPKPARVRPKQQEEEGIVDTLLSADVLPYAAGAGGGSLALLLGWLGYRAKNKKDNDFEESILDSHITDDNSNFDLGDSEIGDSEVGDLMTEVSVSSNETSFLSDFSADDMESLQPDDTEADPISEADVFMVYGRYQQAEELLEEAIAKEPGRLDFQMKLLEVYHGDKLKDSFILQTDVVKGLLEKSTDDFANTEEWRNVVSWSETLGIDVENPDSGSASEEDDDSFNLDESDFNLNDDTDFSLSDFGSDSDSTDDDLDFSLNDSPPESDDLLSDGKDKKEESSFELEDNNDLDLEKNSEQEETLDLELDGEDELDAALDLDGDDDFDMALDLDGDGDLDATLDLDGDLDATLDLDGDLEATLDLGEGDELEADFDLDGDDDLEAAFDLDGDGSDDLEAAFDLDGDGSDDLEAAFDLDGDGSDDLEAAFDLDGDDDLEATLELGGDDELGATLELGGDDELGATLDLGGDDELEAAFDLDDDGDDDLEAAFDLDGDGELDLTGDEFDLEDGDDLSDAFDLDGDDDLTTDLDLEEGGDDDLDMFDVGTDFDDLSENAPELDAVATKLDLARAYVEMGDMDSADSILREVIDEGDAKQKSEAESLLKQGSS